MSGGAQPKLTFGYLYDFRNPPQWRRDWAEVYAEVLDFAVWSEQAGFAAACVPEHHGAGDGYMPSPLVALAALAARTSTIRLGSGVALAPLYHPVRFAEDCAVLDILANGRLEMGLGIGYRRRETAAHGVDFTKRGARFDEFLEIVTRLWAGEEVSFAGQHFAIDKARIDPLPPRGRVPLAIGGFAPRAIARVAKYADVYFGGEEAIPAYQAALAAQGKDPASARVAIPMLFTLVARDPAAAMEELAPRFHHVNNLYGVWAAEDQPGANDGPTLKPMSLEKFKASGILEILTPDQAVEKFTALRARAPAVDHIAMMLPPGLPPEQFKPYAELFAKEVIPAFG